MTKEQLTLLFLETAGVTSVNQYNVRKVLKKWWVSPSSKTSLRLTAEGATFLTDVLKLKSYNFKLDPHKITGRLIILMNKHITVPFYFKGSVVTMYGEKDLVMIMLNGNNLEQYLTNIDRYKT